MVTAAAYDGARLAAGAGSEDDPAAAEATARAHVRSLLGAYGGSAERLPVVIVERGTEVTVVTVEAVNPSFLPVALRRPVGLDRISRTVRVRTETEVAAP